MGLTKKKDVSPPQGLTFNIRIKIRKIRNLRILEDLETKEMPVSCDNIKEIETETAIGLNCLTSEEINGTPAGMQIITDDINSIGGIPEDADPDKLKSNVDYSKKENLQLINDLPTVNITEFDGSDCEENGTYVIKGIIAENKNNFKSNYKNVIVPFSSPDSSGLCDVSLDNKNVTFNCNNREKFDISSIIFEPTIIQDSEKNITFKINGYIDKKRFACDLSVNSVLESGNTTPSFFNSPIKNTKSSGISGAAIAGIVICLVAAVAVIATIIICIKTGKIANVQAGTQINESRSTLNSINNIPQKNIL